MRWIVLQNIHLFQVGVMVIVQRAVIAGCKVVLSTEEYSDGSLGAFTVELSKATVDVIQPIRALCHAVSLGLQHGIPLEVYVDAFLFTGGGLYVGEVSGNDAIETTTSIVDYIFRELAISYLDRTDLVSQSFKVTSTDLSGSAVPPFVSFGFLRGQVPSRMSDDIVGVW